MSIRNLERIFKPRHVAVIGTGGNAGTVAERVLENLRESGFPGAIYRVDPEGRAAGDLWSVEQLPHAVDLAIVATPAARVADVAEACGRAGILGLVILSSGFREQGPDGAALERQIAAAAARWPGMRILGPNCAGVLAPHRRFNATGIAVTPPAGRIALISQSGGLLAAVLDWASDQQVGFSHVASYGNALDIDVGDLIDYFSGDPWTDGIVLYAESISGARKFMSAARAFTRSRPLMAYKAGRFVRSAQAAASHTGALAAVDSVYAAAFARAGVVRVAEVGDLLDCVALLARQKRPTGPRLAIVTDAGAPGVMATDALLEQGGALAQLAPTTGATLQGLLPTTGSGSNPVDLGGESTAERLAAVIDAVLRDPGVDGLLVLLVPQAAGDPLQTAEAVAGAARRSHKPVIAAWLGGATVRRGARRLSQVGIPTYSTPEDAVRAFIYLVAYAQRREILQETPREVQVPFTRAHRDRTATCLPPSRTAAALDEIASQSLLENYDIPVAPATLARSAEEAVRVGRRLGRAVALKVLSPDLIHKTDVGGVELHLSSAEEIAAGFQRIMNDPRLRRVGARAEGVVVQPMIVEPSAQELIVGAKRDPEFGMVMMLGAGGTSAEVLRDTAFELPPLNERLARRMLESLRSWPLLAGYRGRSGVNLQRLVEVLIRLSYLVAEHPEISELDVNPLLATAEEVIALDARVLVDPPAATREVRPYAHLAIRPYPDEFIRGATLADGRSIVLRPIRPEDEPLWLALLGRCSAESIYRRFFGVFKTQTHEVAARYCFVDYDRELAIVAEAEEAGERLLMGVGRLVADPDHEVAEYAVLVGDPWQGIGLGSLLTDYSLEVARRWGVTEVVAETMSENRRMLNVFRRRGFVEQPPRDGTVVTRKRLAPV